MARVCTLGQYNPDTEEWTQYVERMEFYFIANDIGSEESNVHWMRWTGYLYFAKELDSTC